ncbi:methylenetetrahydrofolate reductase [Candidatus Carsonella ruddii]|uniref:methylenetetrahydrofolate reductase n=1 Tax=Carsonella ruddii TaxID=114186 RepID=UPI003D3FD802
MKNISFEIFPSNNIKESIDLVKHLEKKNPNFISITCNKNNNFNFIYNLKKKILTKLIPHLICDTIFNVVDKIINFIKIKIFDFIIITGDNVINNSFSFINTIRKLFGFTIRIYSGSYLEEHKTTKNIKKEIMFLYKKKKIGINLFITQFFYNFNIINYYINKIKKTNINKNFILGIFPKKNIKEILFFANKCKIEIPVWFIKNYNLINIKNYYLKNLNNYNFFHFYTFNNINFIEYYLK